MTHDISLKDRINFLKRHICTERQTTEIRSYVLNLFLAEVESPPASQEICSDEDDGTCGDEVRERFPDFNMHEDPEGIKSVPSFER